MPPTHEKLLIDLRNTPDLIRDATKNCTAMQVPYYLPPTEVNLAVFSFWSRAGQEVTGGFLFYFCFCFFLSTLFVCCCFSS